ncbi:helix-turn-helix domain-containing protein [Marilutibacter aestuarii]|uniref:CRP-like protein Clp n=1 Tax=Marilutibacter aestuarii TaxID=1706195 RepID=A0A508ALF6_9GAMM|nr:helix-turn-helix domain-containing protein [Lysobacter aestuarii]TQD50970.1 cyclic nucleotide-binding domain-containing protein [Lysobacter aestuarii]
MNEAVSVDLARLRRSCANCSLQQLCLPAGIGVDALARLEAIVRRPRTLRRGERLYRIGDPLGAVYVASSGAFKTASLSESGEEQVTGFHLPGELIGLDGLGEGAHRCEAVALVDSHVCEVPLERLTAVALQLPGLHEQLLRVIGRSMDRDHLHTDLLVRRQAHERLALFLLGLSERYAQIGQSAREFRLPMSREEVARYLGLALETVSRGLTRMQEDGVLAVHGRRVEVLDREALSALAHGREGCAEADPGKRRQA